MKAKSFLNITIKGLTLVELLVVVCVLGIIAGIAIPSITSMNTLPRFKGHFYPSNENELAKIPAEENVALWEDWRHLPSGGWRLATTEEMTNFVENMFIKTGSRNVIVSPAETSTYGVEKEADVNVNVRNIVTPKDQTVKVYMMSADGNRVISRHIVSPVGVVLLVRK